MFALLKCKYKVECEELELSYALDTNLNYDKGHGQELAAETDKNSKDKNTYSRLQYYFIINNRPLYLITYQSTLSY